MKTRISFLYGITTGRWLRLLWDNRFRISPSCTHRAALLTLVSLFNSYQQVKERRRFDAALVEAEVEDPPIFIMGHWRSGTTHLHNILNEDPLLATPNTFEVMFPHTFLTTEDTYSRKMAFLIPARRPQDNVPLGWNVPQEDEIAMCMSTLFSPALTFSFPREENRYNRYLTFRGVPEKELRDWQRAYKHFIKKLWFRHRRPIVLKSPPHTCRIKVLLELFPRARFVHIIRDPYRVYLSTIHLFQTLEENFFTLQRPSGRPHGERVLGMYEQMHEAYFDEVDQIPPGQFHLMRHEDLERDPVGEIRRMYAALDISDFDRFEPRLKEYVAGLADYRKNRYPSLDSKIKEEVAIRWQRNFVAWDYPLE